MADLSVPSGAKVVINIADWEDAFALKNAINKEISKKKFNINLAGLSLDSEFNIAEFMSVALAVDSSPVVNEALKKCLIRSTYNGQKITSATFEPAECRQDYYPIVMECLMVNTKDFFVPLVSRLLSLLSMTASTKNQK